LILPCYQNQHTLQSQFAVRKYLAAVDQGIRDEIKLVPIDAYPPIVVLPLPSQLGFVVCRKFTIREIKHTVLDFVLKGDIPYPYLRAVFG
jgi:hypothetical protein